MNIPILKNILRSELSIYNEKRRQYDDTLYLKDLLEELTRLINVESINELHNNMLGISIIQPLIYEKEESKLIENKMYNMIYRLINYYGKKDLKDEYIKEEKKLKILLNKFYLDFSIAQNNLNIYQKELESKNKGQIFCRKILYRINHSYYLSDDLIQYVKRLLHERNYPQEQIIIALEFLAHHNQRVKYNIPKISYTTIKMVESDFSLLELEDLQDREKKAKLDSFSYSTFETLIEEEDFEYVKEFLNEMTAWMDDGEFEYAIKSVLNKFLEVLQTCKNDMLEGSNYEDEELRKLIIAEYNNYYYKFKNIEKYYLEKIQKEDKENPELEIGGGIESLPTKENSFIFASGISKSFIERDIEDVPEEYFDRVKYLLEEFKKGILPDKFIEGFVRNSKLKGFFKLKDDQVRIIFRPLNNNTYYFLGVIVKKDTDGNREYIRIISRNKNIDINNKEELDYLITEGEEIYTNIISYLETYSRKGNR